MAKRLKAEDRKESILQASKGLFARHGLAGVSVNELSKACGVAPAVLYQHFPSKEDIYRAVLSRFASAREHYVDALLAGPDDFGNVLYRITVVNMTSRVRDPDILRIELRSLIEEDSFSEAIFDSHWKGITDYIEFSLAEMIDAGLVPSMDIQVASMNYVGMFRELLLRYGFGTTQEADDDIRYLIKQVINAYLRSIGLAELQW